MRAANPGGSMGYWLFFFAVLVVVLIVMETLAVAVSSSPADTQTQVPTAFPALLPTRLPTPLPTRLPTRLPTAPPTTLPTTLQPTKLPTIPPTQLPTILPTRLPTTLPTLLPTRLPTLPTRQPTASPSTVPTLPTPLPTASPTAPTTHQPTASPVQVRSIEVGMGITVAPSSSQTIQFFNFTITTVDGVDRQCSSLILDPEDVAHPATNMADGDPTTYWSSGLVSGGFPVTLFAICGAIQRITRVRIIQTSASALEVKTAFFYIKGTAFPFPFYTNTGDDGIVMDEEDFSWYPDSYSY